MNISSQVQEFSRAPTQSFFVYTINNDSAFQRYAFLDRFDVQMSESSAHGLVVYEHPARLVDEALADGSFDKESLLRWLNEADQALDSIRRHRNRMLVVERNASGEQRFKSQFGAVFGKQSIPAECAPRPKQETTLQSLIAYFAVRQFAPVAQAMSELEASSIATINGSPLLDESLEFVAKEMSALQSRIPVDKYDAMKQEFQSLKNENRELAALKPALNKLEQENSALQKRREALEQENSALQKRCEALEQENSALQKRCEALEQENRSNASDTNDILMRQIVDLENVLRDADKEEKRAAKDIAAKAEAISDANAKNARLKTEIAELKKSMDLVYGSTSWRLTAPVRAIKSTFSR